MPWCTSQSTISPLPILCFFCAERAATAYGTIAGGETLSLRYAPDVKRAEDLTAALEKARDTDLRRGVTTRGPHRDDVTIQVHDRAARSFASQGQQKTAALAVKLAEIELVKEMAGEYPILMLDEVLSELDAGRARRLLEAIGGDVQCVLTTTDVDGSNTVFGSDCRDFVIEGGCLARR